MTVPLGGDADGGPINQQGAGVVEEASPSKITSTRCEGRNTRKTAVAAEASVGATMAPNATAAAQGISGKNSLMTTATETDRN